MRKLTSSESHWSGYTASWENPDGWHCERVVRGRRMRLFFVEGFFAAERGAGRRWGRGLCAARTGARWTCYPQAPRHWRTPHNNGTRFPLPAASAFCLLFAPFWSRPPIVGSRTANFALRSKTTVPLYLAPLLRPLHLTWLFHARRKYLSFATPRLLLLLCQKEHTFIFKKIS